MKRAETYLKEGDGTVIDIATKEDLTKLLNSGARFISVELGRPKEKTQLTTALVGDSASLLIFADARRRKSFSPGGSLPQADAQAILERYIEHGDRHPGYTWRETSLPWIRHIDWGTLGKTGHLIVLAAAILLAVVGVWLWMR